MQQPTSRYVLPVVHERTSGGIQEMDPYSKLLTERIVFLGTPIDDTAANDVMAQLIHLEHASPDSPISLYINSPGGSFTAMTAIYDTLQFVTSDIETVCLGQAGSAAAVLLAAGTRGKRLALPNARVVLHQPSLAEPAQGQTSDLAIQADELQRMRVLLEELLARHTGRALDQVKEDIEREVVLDAAAAIEYGLIDALVDSRKGLRAEM